MSDNQYEDETPVLPDSTEIIDENSRIYGQVKWFNTKAGYGFITVCKNYGNLSGKDIFVHYTAISVVNSQYKYLVQGEYVEFSIVKLESEKYEYHAVRISGICGGTIMCEIRRLNVEAAPASVPKRKSNPIMQRQTTNDDVPQTDDDAGFELVTRGKNRIKNKNNRLSQQQHVAPTRRGSS